MSEKINISVIVPFYNAKNYIKNCIDNLSKQDFNKPFEIIMIDDASTDQSLQIIEQNYLPMIKLYKLKNNQGPASARNLGIKKASGEYIFFLDVDDSIASNTLSKLHNELQNYNYDIVICDKKWIENSQNQRSNIFVYSSDKILDKSDIHQEMRKRFNDPISNVGIFGLTGRLIKKSLILNNKIYFNEKLRYLEDEIFSWNVLSFAHKIKYIKDQLYSYYVNPNISSALSDGLNRGFSISNFKIVRDHIKKSLINSGFPEGDIKKIGDQAFIFFIISALVSFSKSIILKKIEKRKGIEIRKKIIDQILSDKEVLSAVKTYKISKFESSLIPKAISWKSSFLLSFACNKRAKEILNIRRKT
jgi:glycosyltransferase involved in cell wall biosynthesis